MGPPMPSATATWHNNTYAAISPLRPELSASGKTVIITGAVSHTSPRTLSPGSPSSTSSFTPPFLPHRLSRPVFDAVDIRLILFPPFLGEWYWQADGPLIRQCRRCPGGPPRQDGERPEGDGGAPPFFG